MNFIEATTLLEATKLLELDKNIKLKRRSKEVTVILHPLGNHFMKDDSHSLYLTTIDDILAEDWYVVKDKKLHTFEEALTYFKEGKYIRRKIHNDYLRFHKDGHREFGAIDVMGNDWIIIDKEETE